LRRHILRSMQKGYLEDLAFLVVEGAQKLQEEAMIKLKEYILKLKESTNHSVPPSEYYRGYHDALDKVLKKIESKEEG
jgi:hypothetical protein